MNEFLLDIISRSENELRQAMADHDAAVGDWKTANTRIGFARTIADAALVASGRRRSREHQSLGNVDTLALLAVILSEASR